MKIWLPLYSAVFLTLPACALQTEHPESAPAHVTTTTCTAPAAQRAPGNVAIKEATGRSSFDLKLGIRSFHVGHGAYKLPNEDENWNRMYGYGPVVWIKDGKRTRTLDLRAEFPSNLVSHVFFDEASGRLVLFLENGIEGPGNEYLTWISLDRGDHWFRGADLARPQGANGPASLENFLLDKDGRGFALLKAESDGSDAWSRAATTDCGQSWNAGALITSSLRNVKEKQ
jgi:hypothetical protein